MAAPAVSEGLDRFRANNPSAQSGADGRFRIEGLTEGRYQVTATLDPDRASEVVTVPSSAPIELRLEKARHETLHVPLTQDLFENPLRLTLR